MNWIFHVNRHNQHCENICLSENSRGWSSWTPWSECNRDCVRHRRRACNDPKPSNGGTFCGGQNHDVDVCLGGSCTGNNF